MLDVPSQITGAQENYSSTFSAELSVFLELCSEPPLIFVLDFVPLAMTSLFSIDPFRGKCWCPHVSLQSLSPKA